MNQQPTEFTSFILTEREQHEGRILSPVQVAVIQNERAVIATQILNLVFTPSDPDKFVQQDAYLKGQLAAYTAILLASEAEINSTLSTSNQPIEGN